MAEVETITVIDALNVNRDIATATKLANLIGEVQASPTSNTLLDRLKALATSLSVINASVDGLETLIGTTNSTLNTIAAYVDGLEGQVTAVQGLMASPSTAGTVALDPNESTPFTIKALNTSRKQLTIYNNTTQALYVLLGTGTVASTLFTINIAAGTYYELPVSKGGVFTGIVTGLSAAAATGKIQITEIT